MGLLRPPSTRQTKKESNVKELIASAMVAGAAFVIVNLSAMCTALAQDKECELAEDDPERSITACSGC